MSVLLIVAGRNIACRIAYCPLVSHVEYASRAQLRLEKTGQTDGRTDGRTNTKPLGPTLSAYGYIVATSVINGCLEFTLRIE